MPKKTEVALSVVIPTYNGANRLPAVLDRLQNQTVPAHLKWEVIVVDNNSQDRIAAVVEHYQSSWRPDVRLRYAFEPSQGLAFARQCGVDQAQGEFVGFLDDDNWPTENWVVEVVNFGRQYPKVGAYGGKTDAAFEAPPQMPIKPIAKFLALQDYGDRPYRLQPERQILPAGAGLVIRRSAWLACIPKQLVRTSQGGDDYEISLRLAKYGWEIYYNPKMQIQHHIPASRLERSYLLQLTHRYGLCTCELMMIEASPWRQPFLITKFSLGTLKRITQHILRHGLQQSDIALQCQMSFYQGNFMGIWHYLLNQLSRYRLPVN